MHLQSKEHNNDFNCTVSEVIKKIVNLRKCLVLDIETNSR